MSDERRCWAPPVVRNLWGYDDSVERVQHKLRGGICPGVRFRVTGQRLAGYIVNPITGVDLIEEAYLDCAKLVGTARQARARLEAGQNCNEWLVLADLLLDAQRADLHPSIVNLLVEKLKLLAAGAECTRPARGGLIPYSTRAQMVHEFLVRRKPRYEPVDQTWAIGDAALSHEPTSSLMELTSVQIVEIGEADVKLQCTVGENRVTRTYPLEAFVTVNVLRPEEWRSV